MNVYSFNFSESTQNCFKVLSKSNSVGAFLSTVLSAPPAKELKHLSAFDTRRPATIGVFSALQLLQGCFFRSFKVLYTNEYSLFGKFSKSENFLIFFAKKLNLGGKDIFKK